MAKYDDVVRQLGPLETFKASTFTGNDACPQAVCDLILGLALIHCDLRDVILAQSAMDSVQPSDLQTPTPELGHFAGITAHLVRLQAGILHELLELVRKQMKTTRLPAFRQLVDPMTKRGRLAWYGILAAADEKPANDPLAKLLFFARNKVAFHYDLKELRKGYANKFIRNSTDVPYVSIGTNMAETRFYFADAAADTYMRDGADDATVQDFFSGRAVLLKDVNSALYELVVRFLRRRARLQKVKPRTASTTRHTSNEP